MATASALIPAAPATQVSTADVFRAGRFEPNDWTILADDAEFPSEGQVLVPFARLIALLASGQAGNRRIGVLIGPADPVPELAPHIDRIAVAAIDFPKYSDGRGFSQAVRLARLGFAGEIRAVGNVLIDQVAMMVRVGVTAFEIRHAPTRRLLEAGHDPAPRRHYQPSAAAEPPAGSRPWLRLTR
jgi:phosphoadenosine phosphosulfate reductase